MNTVHEVRRKIKGSKLHILFLGLLVFLIGCPQHVRVSDLEHNPGRYYNKEVAVTGTVVESFGLLGEGAFQIDDGTGKIWVLSENYGIPGKGQRVGVVGNLVGGVSVGTRSLATAIRMTHHPHY